MIRLQRVVACDTPECPCVSIDVLRTVDVSDGEIPDWQGWQEVVDPLAECTKHYCPECVAVRSMPVTASSEWAAP